MDAATASSSTLTINKVVIRPANVAVGQHVAATVTFDTTGLSANLGKQVNITYSYPGGSYTDSAIVQGSTVVLNNFVTPDTPGTPYTVTWTVDAAGQDSKSDSFTVYGPAVTYTFEYKGNPLVLPDGTIVVMANGYSQQKFLLTARDSDGNIVNANGIRVTSSERGDLNYVLDAYSRAIVTVGPELTSSSETITATISGIAGSTHYRLRFINGNLEITAYNRTNHFDPINKTKIGDIIDINVKLNDGDDPMGDVPVSIKCIWPNGTVDMVNSGVYTTTHGGADKGTVRLFDRFTAGLQNTNTVNVFLVQVPVLGLMDACMVSGYSTNAAYMDIIVTPVDPATDGISYRSVNADGLHGYTIIAHVRDIHGNSVFNVPVDFYTYSNLDTNGEFTSEITNVYNAATSDLGSASAATQPHLNPGKIKVNISTINNLHQDVILYYTAGEATLINVAAYPMTVASGDVVNTNIANDIHATKLVAYVTDDWGHPIADQTVDFTVEPDNDGNINGTVTPATGKTDINGMLSGQFVLASTAIGEGEVNVTASSGSLPLASVKIKNTEDKFLNITTSLDKSRVAVNGVVNVTVNVSGVGWQLGRKPADVIFVMDRSGSMGDALGYTNYGTDAGGWFAPTVITNSGLSTSGWTNITYNHDKFTRMILKVWQSTPSYPTRDAKIISADFPGSMDSNETRTVQITMKNPGSLPWMESSVLPITGETKTEGVRLGAYNSTAYTNFGMNGTCGSSIRSKLPASFVVNKDDTYTFTFTITAPIVHGTTDINYNLQYRMIWEGIVWFGDTISKNIKVKPDGIPTPTPTVAPTPVPTPAATGTDTFPSIIDSGETKTVTVTMKNTGDVSFPWPVSTSQYALTVTGSTATFGMGTTTFYVKDYVASDVNKDGTVTFSFPITGPKNIGANKSFSVTYKMYKDGAAFGTGYTKWITVYNSSIPRASALYGDWYYVKNFWNPDGKVITGLSSSIGWAPMTSSTTSVYGILTSGTGKGTLPTYGSTTPSLTKDTYAPPGVYSIQTGRYYVSGAAASYNLYVWDDMKMGQMCDADATAKRSARTFIDNNLTNENDRAGLVTFNSTATTDMGLVTLNKVGTTDKQSLKDAINETNSAGGTSFAAGLLNARMEFDTNPSTVGASKYEIFLTDGWSNTDPAQDLIEAQNTADDHITVFTIGIGDTPTQVNEAYLKDLASMTGGQYFFVRDNVQLLEAYSTIGKIINQNITREGSTLNLIPERIEIDGALVDSTSYVPGSAYTIKNNTSSTMRQVEPTITVDDGESMLSWAMDPIKIGDNWSLRYQIRANANGSTHPIGPGSRGVFTPFENPEDIYICGHAQRPRDNRR